VILDPRDTIVAVASPAGPGLRGILRLSGPRAHELALDDFRPDRAVPATGASLTPGRLHVAGLRADLPAAVALWPCARTYTGQPLAEVHTVGAPPLVQLALAHFLARGARLAEPGEFTLRAFLSGRIDLTQAEAVLGVIDAQTPVQVETALRQLAGGLSGPIASLRDRLLDVLAHLEAGLDFVDEADVDPIERSRLGAELRLGVETLAELHARLERRERPDRLPRVVLIGPPNAGKSRLFNALGDDARAIVAPTAGTTRDVLAARCSCGDGLVVELIDTAGVEEACDGIAARAQDHRRHQGEIADLVLVCSPSGATPPESLATSSLKVATKCDLAPAPGGWIATSAATGMGLDRLRQEIALALGSRDRDGDAVAATAARCRDSLRNAEASLRRALDSLRRDGAEELAAIDLRQALDDLGRVVGAIVTDDLLDRIFSRFCIGK
jgi:tRNA modification GTPase